MKRKRNNMDEQLGRARMIDRMINRQEERIKEFERRTHTFSHCINYLKEYYPDYIPIDDHYEYMIRKNICGGSLLLDAGCGWKSSIIERFSNEDIKIIGTDIDIDALADNVTHNNKLGSDLEKLPFKDCTFDIIISKCVFEHIEKPEVVFREFSRVLKKGGCIIAIFPNIYNPVMLVGKLTPLYMHKKLMRTASNIHEEDIYHTYFRCNSVRTLDIMLNKIGFVREELKPSGDFILFMFSRVSFHLWIIFDKLTNNRFLKFTKMNICICYKKRGHNTDIEKMI